MITLLQKTAPAIVTNLVLAALVIISQNQLPPVVPLFYGLPVSDQQLVPAYLLTLPCLLAAALGLANTFALKFIPNEFLQKVTLATTFSITLMAAITTIRIFLLVR